MELPERTSRSGLDLLQTSGFTVVADKLNQAPNLSWHDMPFAEWCRMVPSRKVGLRPLVNIPATIENHHVQWDNLVFQWSWLY